MTQAHILRLSQEIMDEIVDFIERSSLGACAVTHRAFLHRCQSRLFSTIEFYSDMVEWGDQYREHRCNRINDFLEILLHSPHIARYVRGLYLQISSLDNRWVAEDPNFIKILDLVKQSGSCIKKLELIGTSFPEKISDARIFEQSFLQPFISSSLTTLVISGMVDIPMSLIANSPNLKYLKTYRSSLEGFGDNLDLNLLQCSPKIRTLHYFPPDATIESILVHSTKCLSRTSDSGRSYIKPGLYAAIFIDSMFTCDVDISPIADLADLRSITTVIWDLEVLQSIIQLSKSSLEELNLFDHAMLSDDVIKYDSTSHRSEPLADWIDLSKVHQLRILSVDVVFPSPATGCDALEDICRVLKTIPSENRLEDITLNAYVGFKSCAYGPVSANKANWELFDSEITRIACRKALNLYLQIAYQLPESDYWASDDELINLSDSANIQRDMEQMCQTIFRKLVQERLPQINSASFITLDFTYNVSDPD